MTKPVKGSSGPKQYNSNCCTVPFLIVFLLFFFIIGLGPLWAPKRTGKAKEAEVKQNCHAIQLALERYAVDHDGAYPLRISGGDWTDTQVVWESWVLKQCPNGDMQEMLQHITNDEKRHNWDAAAPDMGDPLVMESYMPSYPGNPFVKFKKEIETIQIHHHPGTLYPSHKPWWRYVGGRESNKMWEVFGPTFTGGPEVCSNAGDIYVHHIFNKPPYQFETDEWKEPPGGWLDPSGNEFLAGNFSYWPRAGVDQSWYLTPDPEVVGYTIAGYGSMRTAGQDVYNRNGNYKGRYRTESCVTDCERVPQGSTGSGILSYPTDIPCLCDSGLPPSAEHNNGGSDTIIDGVIITLDSGVDKKSAKTDFSTTESD